MTDNVIHDLIPEIICDPDKKLPHNVIQGFLDVSNDLVSTDYRLEIIDVPRYSGKYVFCITVNEKTSSQTDWVRITMPTEPGDISGNSIRHQNIDKLKTKEWVNADELYELMKRNNFIPGTFWWQWYFFGE